MPNGTTAILPIRDFHGMTRLASVLTSDQRSALIRELCDRSAAAVHGAGLRAVVVSSSAEVVTWANQRGLESQPDPGEGLSRAASDTVALLGETPWIVLHTDLPDVTSESLSRIAELSMAHTVFVPSHDGGTNVIAASGPFPFSYGGGSFHRHLKAVPNAVVISNANLSIDIDSPRQLAAFPDLVKAVGSHHGIQPL